MRPRIPFVAGSSGVVGRAVTALLAQRGAPFLAHVRPHHAASDPHVVPFDLADETRLATELGRCTTVVQLIGTMRKRFASGDTYETSDVGTTRQLVAAARRAGTIDHIVLLSSVGAGRPLGAYLKAKAAAESLVCDSGIPWTVFRPSAFVGEDRRPPPGTDFLTRALGLTRYRPIRVEQLAKALVDVTLDRAPLQATLEGDSLWSLVTP